MKHVAPLALVVLSLAACAGPRPKAPAAPATTAPAAPLASAAVAAPSSGRPEIRYYEIAEA